MDFEYRYHDGQSSHAHAYLLPVLDVLLRSTEAKTIMDVGCGNGSVAGYLSERYNVTGIDVSESGISHGKIAYPDVAFHQISAYDDLAVRFGVFDVVISLEVVEHLYDPRRYIQRVFELTKPGGHVILTTPYHGYIKNVFLAATGSLDRHFTALWDGGHIKFWSKRTLAELLREGGFTGVRFKTAGRIPIVAKSLVAFADRPL